LHGGVVSRQRDADQSSTPPERSVGLVEGGGGCRQRHRDIGAAEPLNGGDRVLGAGIDDVIGAQFGGHREFAVLDVNADGKTACDPGIG